LITNFNLFWYNKKDMTLLLNPKMGYDIGIFIITFPKYLIKNLVYFWYDKKFIKHILSPKMRYRTEIFISHFLE